MTPGGVRTLLALAALLAALVFCGAGQAKAGCVSRLLADWRDGRIDGTYSVACYRTALAHLPEDVRIYSSAESDIKRALVARSEVALAAPAKAKTQSRSDGNSSNGVSPLLVLAVAGAILAALGSAFALAR
jgi:hypothetical protein